MTEIVCPSGLRGRVRGMTVGDEDVLSKVTRTAVKGGKASDAIYQIVQNCWVDVIDPGPYTDMTTLQINRLLSVDMQYALMQVRAASWGDMVNVEADCPHGHRVSGDVPISGCDFRPPSPQALQAIRTDGAVDFKLPSIGRIVKFWPLTVGVEERATDAMEAMPNEPVSEALVARIAEIEGFDANLMDTETEMDIRGWIKQMPSADAMALRRAMAEADGAIDTEVHIPCDEDQSVAVADIMVTADFFAPRAGRISFKKSTT
jgi:hypothetical protein